MKYKNYCNCKKERIGRRSYLVRDPDCFAKYIHNGKKYVEIDNLEMFYKERNRPFNEDFNFTV